MKITCPNCGFSREVPADKLPAKASMATCPQCQHRFRFRELDVPTDNTRQDVASASDLASPPPTPPKEDKDFWEELESLNSTGAPGDQERTDTEAGTPETEEPPAPAEEALPPRTPAWERATSNYPLAFIHTFTEVLLSPKQFFKTLPVGAGVIKPLLFFLVIIEAVAISQAVWQLLGIIPPSPLTESLGHNLQAALSLILYPLQVAIFLFLDTAINHAFLHLLKAGRKGFEGTFRAEAYSAAPMLLIIIPYIGLPMAAIGMTVYKFLGIRHIHGATTGQTIAALVLPMLLAVALGLLLALSSGQV